MSNCGDHYEFNSLRPLQLTLAGEALRHRAGDILNREGELDRLPVQLRDEFRTRLQQAIERLDDTAQEAVGFATPRIARA